jgi:hypothetical protein
LDVIGYKGMRGCVIGVAVYREEVCIVGVRVAGCVQLGAQRRESDPWVALVIVGRKRTAPSVAVCVIGIGGGVFEVRIDFRSCRFGVATGIVGAGLEGKGTHHNVEVRERGLRAKLPSAHTGEAFCTYERWIMRIPTVVPVGAHAVDELRVAGLLSWRVRWRSRAVV